MPPRVRRLALSIHVALSVGWMGAVAAYLALDLAAVTGHDPDTLRAAYVGMELIVSRVVVPLSIAALATGVLMAVGTRWGLFRHYWVLISLLLTAVAVAVLLVEARTIASLAATAADPATSAEELRALGGTLVHSIGGLVVLSVVLVLNMYKPRGLTRYGWRRQREESDRGATRRWRLTL